MASTFVAPPLDFDVLKEIWNKYELSDHSFLKVKVVLTGVNKAQASTPVPTGTVAPPNYNFNMQHIVTILTNERGQPDARNYPPAEIQASIIRDDMRFSTITQDWNEYVVDDGTRIKVQPIIMRVAKTSKFNNKGEPVYWVEINMTVQVKPPMTSPSLPPPTS